jgi:hypothetical protein
MEGADLSRAGLPPAAEAQITRRAVETFDVANYCAPMLRAAFAMFWNLLTLRFLSRLAKVSQVFVLQCPRAKVATSRSGQKFVRNQLRR